MIRTRTGSGGNSFGEMLRQPLGDEELAALIRDQPWYRQATRVRRAEELALLHERMDWFHACWDQIVRRTIELGAARKRICSQRRQIGHGLQHSLAPLCAQARSLRDRLDLEWLTFRERVYRRLSRQDVDRFVRDRRNAKARRTLTDRFENILKPGVEDCRAALGRLIKLCKADD